MLKKKKVGDKVPYALRCFASFQLPKLGAGKSRVAASFVCRCLLPFGWGGEEAPGLNCQVWKIE